MPRDFEGEPFEQHVPGSMPPAERLRLWAEDTGTYWDLSTYDRAALQAVLAERQALIRRVQELTGEPWCWRRV